MTPVQMVIMPVANGIMPHPDSGRITAMFIFETGGQILNDLGPNNDILVCPWVIEEQALYPVGVVCRILKLWTQTVVDEDNNEIQAVMAVLEGRYHARWSSFTIVGMYILSSDVERIDLKMMRKSYPSISVAGWMPLGGYTEFRSRNDIPVTIYGQDLSNAEKVSLTGNLGGIISEEKAHTIEHAIIRALRTYGLCTPKTLKISMEREATELKNSVEYSIRYQLPEVLGITNSGVCGNPMTNMAQLYLAKDFIKNIKAGENYEHALTKARRKTMSKLTQELNISTDKGLRVLQGLKHGMKHDDTDVDIAVLKRILTRFPFDPWY